MLTGDERLRLVAVAAALRWISLDVEASVGQNAAVDRTRYGFNV